jgi:hypothetical protein
MNSKPTKSDDAQLEFPVLDEVVDPDSDRARLMTALDELNRLIDRVPKAGQAVSDETLAALQQDLVEQLTKRIDALTTQLKNAVPALVEAALRKHLK